LSISKPRNVTTVVRCTVLFSAIGTPSSSFILRKVFIGISNSFIKASPAKIK
jgi:hypothetical protein